MREYLEKIPLSPLSPQEAERAMCLLTSGGISDGEIAVFLTAYRDRPVTAPELSGFRAAMLKQALPLRYDRMLLDLCGTGGDGKNSFNISTAAAFVVAACGVPVAKHGNYGVSSVCGSSNVLEHLGIPFARSEDDARRQLDSCSLTFLHAPLWHPAMKTVAAVRKQLGFKTIFNMLGPLVNPAAPRFQLLGVHSPELQRLYSEILNGEQIEYAVITTHDGYDEISLTAPVSISQRGQAFSYDPIDFGTGVVSPVEIEGGSSIGEYAAILLDVLRGRGTKAQTDVVCANAALGLSLAAANEPIEEHFLRAHEAIAGGSALKIFEALREYR